MKTERTKKPAPLVSPEEMSEALMGLYLMTDSLLGASVALTGAVSMLIETHPDPAALLAAQAETFKQLRAQAKANRKTPAWMAAFETTADELRATLSRLLAARIRH